MSERITFAVGKSPAGSRTPSATLASLRETAQHLRDRVELCRITFERHRSNENEIEKVRAEQALDDFLAAHPGVR